MGMNFDYGTLGVNNGYTPNFKGASANQAASAPIMDGPSDLELLTLSTKQAENKKNDTMKKAGIVAAVAATIVTGIAYCKGKKINGADGKFFKNIGTGFKNFFKNADEVAKAAGKTVKNGTDDAAKGAKKAAKGAAKGAKKVTQESIESLTNAKAKAQETVTDLERQLKQLADAGKTKGDKYKNLQKQLQTAQHELSVQNNNLIQATKDSLLQADKGYTKLTAARDKNIEQLKALKDEKEKLVATVKELTDKKAGLAKGVTLDADDAKKLADAQSRLNTIGFSAVKGKNGAAPIAAQGQIKTLEEAIQKQSKEISSYAKEFDAVAKARAKAGTNAQLLANFRATLDGGVAQQTWQVQKLNALEKAAKTSQTACTAAENKWASIVGTYPLSPDLTKAVKLKA